MDAEIVRSLFEALKKKYEAGHAHCFVLEKSYFEDTAQEREAEAFAYQLLAPCCVLKRMGKVLGHASVTTTQKYTHVDLEEGRKNISKLSY